MITLSCQHDISQICGQLLVLIFTFYSASHTGKASHVGQPIERVQQCNTYHKRSCYCFPHAWIRPVRKIFWPIAWSWKFLLDHKGLNWESNYCSAASANTLKLLCLSCGVQCSHNPYRLFDGMHSVKFIVHQLFSSVSCTVLNQLWEIKLLDLSGSKQLGQDLQSDRIQWRVEFRESIIILRIWQMFLPSLMGEVNPPHCSSFKGADEKAQTDESQNMITFPLPCVLINEV